LDKVLSEAANEESKSGVPIEAILLIGDLCRHGMAADIGAPKSETEWPLMKYTMTEAFAAIQRAFPDVPILPVIGNNDVVYHDQAPETSFKEEYYSDLWALMFEDVPANSAIASNTTI